MKKLLLLRVIPCLLISSVGISAAEPVLSVDQVLEIGIDDLAKKLGDMSEAGEDSAAQLWASAQRIRTESKLGKSSVQGVQRLSEWRGVLSRWCGAAIYSSSIDSMGGSLYAHITNRNVARIEAFFAKHYRELSTESKHGRPCELDFNKRALSNIKKGLEEFDEDDESSQAFAKRLTDTLNDEQSNLRYMFRGLADEKVKKELIKLLREY